MAKLQREAGDDELLLSIIADAGAKPPREPVSWLKAQIQAKAKAPPRLVVNNDPDDRWGIQAWCAALPGVKPSDPEDRGIGRWELGGKIIDAYATRICEAARLSARWRATLMPRPRGWRRASPRNRRRASSTESHRARGIC
jgi:hypothetical protein